MKRRKDIGDIETEELLRKMEDEVVEVYTTATNEMKEKLDNHLERFGKEDEKKRKQLSSGAITQKDYDVWRKRELMYSDWAKDMLDVLTEDLSNSNKIAMSIVNGYTPEVYATNINYATYEIEQQVQASLSFTLYNAQTVERLIKDNPDLLPMAKVNEKKDESWNKKVLTSAILQGTLQGEGIREIANRLLKSTDMNKNVAIRNARTMTTAAQSMGRQDAMIRAKDLGVDVKRVWMARLDFKTRHSHRQVDGEMQELGNPYSNGLMFPGDPDGTPAEVYNCRCRELPIVDGFNPIDKRINRLGDISYDGWKKGLNKMPEQPKVPTGGNDISGTWKRRPDKFDFEIEDIINAQGFDGLPKVVSKEEFDRAVQESSFIAQRTYTAPSQEILDEYRNQLYNGKWYVDCGTGGAQYGQGMYCAADYTGKLSDGVKKEMSHYQRLGVERFGNVSQSEVGTILAHQKKTADDVLKRFKSGEISKEEGMALYRKIKAMPPSEYLATYMKDSGIGGARSYIETMTLDKSAKIIKHEEIKRLRAEFEEHATGRLVEKAKEPDLIKKIQTKVKSQAGVEITEKQASDLILARVVGINPVSDKLYDESEKARDFAKQFYSENGIGLKKRTEIWKDVKEELKFDPVAIPSDDGSFAALLGYDAINAEGHGDSGSYTVILNRTKVIILGE